MAGRDQIDDAHRHAVLQQGGTLGDERGAMVRPILVSWADDFDRGHKLPAVLGCRRRELRNYRETANPLPRPALALPAPTPRWPLRRLAVGSFRGKGFEFILFKTCDVDFDARADVDFGSGKIAFG